MSKKIKEENKAVLKKMAEKTRKPRAIKNDARRVYFASGKPTKEVPKILIEGNFLKEHGFDAGKTYKLTASEGALQLTIN